MAKRSKLYKAQLAKFDKTALYGLADAVKTLKEMPAVKFDQTVEIAFKLGVDPKQTDQTVRGAIPLPKGTGKKVAITVITDDENLKQEARDAGADFVGYDDIIENQTEGSFRVEELEDDEYNSRFSTAVIVIQKGNVPLERFLKKNIRKEYTLNILEKVRRQEMRPFY